MLVGDFCEEARARLAIKLGFVLDDLEAEGLRLNQVLCSLDGESVFSLDECLDRIHRSLEGVMLDIARVMESIALEYAETKVEQDGSVEDEGTDPATHVELCDECECQGQVEGGVHFFNVGELIPPADGPRLRLLPPSNIPRSRW